MKPQCLQQVYCHWISTNNTLTCYALRCLMKAGGSLQLKRLHWDWDMGVQGSPSTLMGGNKEGMFFKEVYGERNINV